MLESDATNGDLAELSIMSKASEWKLHYVFPRERYGVLAGPI